MKTCYRFSQYVFAIPWSVTSDTNEHPKLWGTSQAQTLIGKSALCLKEKNLQTEKCRLHTDGTKLNSRALTHYTARWQRSAPAVTGLASTSWTETKLELAFKLSRLTHSPGPKEAAWRYVHVRLAPARSGATRPGPAGELPGSAVMKSRCNMGFRYELICPCW